MMGHFRKPFRSYVFKGSRWDQAKTYEKNVRLAKKKGGGEWELISKSEFCPYSYSSVVVNGY